MNSKLVNIFNILYIPMLKCRDVRNVAYITKMVALFYKGWYIRNIYNKIDMIIACQCKRDVRNMFVLYAT